MTILVDKDINYFKLYLGTPEVPTVTLVVPLNLDIVVDKDIDYFKSYLGARYQ